MIEIVSPYDITIKTIKVILTFSDVSKIMQYSTCCAFYVLWKVGKTSIWNVAAMALVLLLTMEASNCLACQHSDACRENTVLNSRIIDTNSLSVAHRETQLLLKLCHP